MNTIGQVYSISNSMGRFQQKVPEQMVIKDFDDITMMNVNVFFPFVKLIVKLKSWRIVPIRFTFHRGDTLILIKWYSHWIKDLNNDVSLHYTHPKCRNGRS